jgi:pimeloyl-ACP methyl ester carboxylesterase
MKRLAAIAVLLALVLVGTASAAGPPPALTTECGSAEGVTATPFWLTTSDHLRLYAIDSGSGATGIVLAHEGGSNLCGWLPYMKTLVDAGFRVLAFDFRGNGLSERPPTTASQLRLGRDLVAATAYLRAHGTPKVFLMGASLGGAAAVQTGAHAHPNGVISLSGTRFWPGYGVNEPATVRALSAPFLYVGCRSDWRAPLPEALQIFRSVGSHDKRTAFYPGSWHGWDIVEGSPFAERARALILSWLQARS